MIESGTTLQGRFLIEEMIGEGGMGAVYTAVDQKFGTRVAIKETFFSDAELAEAFEREARLLNGLHHPIFPHVSDHFSENGGHFLVMEFIEGEDMSVLLKRGEVFPIDDVIAWTFELLDGLDYLHSQDPPIIHRDIKPNNLKRTSRGNVVLLDFGMAKESSVGNTLGMRSVFGYSRRYSPLEQIEGTGTDARSDIFSLGATVYHLLTGKPPVDVLARAKAIVSGRPDPLQPANLLRPDVPEPMAAIIHSALALNSDQRFVSARAMWNALEYAFQESPAVEIEPLGVFPGADALPALAIEPEFPALEAFRDGMADEAVGQELMSDSDAPVFAFDDRESEGEGVMLDRAVIHLDADDPEEDRTEAIEPESDHEPALEVKAPAVMVEPGPERAHSYSRFSGTRSWVVPIVLLLAVLGLYGIYSLSRGPDEAIVEGQTMDSQPAVAATDVPPADAPGNAVDSSSSLDRVNAEQVDPDPEQSDNDSVVARPDAESAEEETPQVVSRRDVPLRGRDEPLSVTAPAERKAAAEPTNRVSRARESTSSSQPRRQSSRAERPRVAPVFDEPGVGSIETVLTGIPYEKRQRLRERLEEEEEKEFRRWVRRERRRNERNRFPPF